MQTRPIPSVSVVMPAYNAAKYIAEAIDSILAQTYTDFEFIIINDGSVDDTEKIIRSYDDPRIVYLKNEVNSGICVTLNKGLDAARGRYIARMDADDISLPQRLAVQVQYMDTHPDIGVAGCLVERFYDDNISNHDFPPSETDSNQCRASLLFSTCVAHPATIIRKHVLVKYGLSYDDRFRGMEDYHLWWRLSQYSSITNISQVLLQYRIHKNQVTQKPVTEDFTRLHKVFVKQRLDDIGIDASVQDVDAILCYMTATSSFDDRRLESLIGCLRKILKKIKSDRRYYKAQQLVAGKAISYSYDLSYKNLRKSNMYYMWRAYRLSCMTFMWFIKRVYHIVF